MEHGYHNENDEYLRKFLNRGRSGGRSDNLPTAADEPPDVGDIGDCGNDRACAGDLLLSQLS